MLGHGVDIVDSGRIRNLIEKYGNHFVDKVYTVAEQEYCRTKAVPHVHFGGRWAAKEAFYKALPDAIQPHSGWKSVEVVPGDGGRRPEIVLLSDSVKAQLVTKGVSSIVLSISHDHDLCIASVILA